MKETNNFVKKEYGDKYNLAKPRSYKNKSKGAQEAHEAIRPTDPTLTPDSIKDHLDPQQLKLYSLIWKRAVATQMSEARLNKTSIDINNHKIGWCKESFDFVQEDSIPSNVAKIRNRSQTMKIENTFDLEKIILYRKHIRINRKQLNLVYEQYDISGINDIIRFNISTFVKNMDNPKIPTYVLEDGGYESLKADKLYYINFIMKFQSHDHSSYSKYRIVFNRSGIKKVISLESII